MEIVIASSGVLVAVLVIAAVMDRRSRRIRGRTDVDDAAAANRRRRDGSHGGMYDHGGGTY